MECFGSMANSKVTLAYPVPVNTNLLESGALSLTWQRYLKMLGDYAVRGAIPTEIIPDTSETNYIGTVSALPDTAELGQTCRYTNHTYIYNGSNWSKSPSFILVGAWCNVQIDMGLAVDAEFVLNLPFESALPFKYEGAEYLAGTKSITIPSGTRVIQCSYCISN